MKTWKSLMSCFGNNKTIIKNKPCAQEDEEFLERERKRKANFIFGNSQSLSSSLCLGLLINSVTK